MCGMHEVEKDILLMFNETADVFKMFLFFLGFFQHKSLLQCVASHNKGQRSVCDKISNSTWQAPVLLTHNPCQLQQIQRCSERFRDALKMGEIWTNSLKNTCKRIHILIKYQAPCLKTFYKWSRFYVSF